MSQQIENEQVESQVIEVRIYPNVSVLVFDDGHEEIIDRYDTVYTPETGDLN